jgi:beta-lactamase superfamily II metal-dependent hydrolase
MLKVHFINVGHGDCIVLEFGDSGRTAVIDINVSSDMDSDSHSEVLNESINMLNALDYTFYQLSGFSDKVLFEKAGYNIELTNPITYIELLNTGGIFRFISTHPHMDHLSGLNALNNNIGITNLWILKNNFCPDCTKLNDDQKKDWAFYSKYRDSSGRELDGKYIIRPEIGDSLQFWNEDKITILSPNDDIIKLAKEKDNPNIMSYVLLIEYAGHKIVLGGDAEKETWKYIHENFETKIKNVSILKASHHGRDSGYYQPAVEIMKPICTIVSVGKKPETDASNKYRTYSKNVWSTRWKGNIEFEILPDGNWTYQLQYDR